MRRLLQPRQPEYGASPRRPHSLQSGDLQHEGDTDQDPKHSHSHTTPTVYKPRLACYRNKTGTPTIAYQLQFSIARHSQ